MSFSFRLFQEACAISFVGGRFYFIEVGVPGLAIGIVVNDRLEHFFSFGYADKKEKTPIDEYTGFQIGSLTKPLIATLAMKMYSDGKINIHQPIQDYLPNELIPSSSRPITLAHL